MLRAQNAKIQIFLSFPPSLLPHCEQLHKIITSKWSLKFQRKKLTVSQKKPRTKKKRRYRWNWDYEKDRSYFFPGGIILLEVDKIVGNSRGGTIKLFRRKNEALSMIARPTASKTRRRSNNGGPRERAQGRSHVVVIQCFPDLTPLRATCATISLCHFSAPIRSDSSYLSIARVDQILDSRNLYNTKWE